MANGHIDENTVGDKETSQLHLSSRKSRFFFRSVMLGGRNRLWFNEFLTQTRRNLDHDEHVMFIYDAAPIHNPEKPNEKNTELEKSPLYSPFLNMVEHAIISALKAAMKANIRRPVIQQATNKREARRQGSYLVSIVNNCL